MFYGPSGSGKKTRIMCLLRELYGAGVERLRNEVMSFTTPSNRKIEITTVGSNYHIEVNPSDAGIYDRVVVIDLIKRLAQTHQIDTSEQREFKVVVLSEVDELTKDAQHALRRTMEKYVATCRLILSVNSISKIIPAIRSRCLGVKVSAPSNDEIISVLRSIGKRENIALPSELAKRIVERCDRNLRRAILMLEACRVQQYPFTANQEVAELDWQIYLRDTAHQILAEQSPNMLGNVRNRLYELLSLGVPAATIFQDLVRSLISKFPSILVPQMLEHAAMYEHRLQNGSKQIFHLEAFIAQIMNIYKCHKNDK